MIDLFTNRGLLDFDARRLGSLAKEGKARRPTYAGAAVVSRRPALPSGLEPWTELSNPLARWPGHGRSSIWEMIAGLDTQKRLAELLCPTLVLVGEKDSSTPPMTKGVGQSACQGVLKNPQGNRCPANGER